MNQGDAGHSSLFLFDQYWWVIFMVIFLALLFSAFTHRKKSRQIGDKILRHDMAARISHWFNASGIFVLLYSGFMLGFLTFPRQVSGTSDIAFIFNIHFLGAILFLFGAVYWVGNTFLAPKRLQEHSPYQGSLKDAILHYLNMAGLTKKHARPTGKYEASERLAFIPLTLLALFMGVTGLIKLSAHVWNVSTGLLLFATWTHDISTIILVVLLVFHILLAAVVPWAWPLLRSMIDGYISVDFAREHHLGWVKELEEEGLVETIKEDQSKDKIKKGERNAR